MKITDFALKHHVATFVLVGLLVIAGIYAYVSLPRESSPDIEIPMVVVTTSYYGVAPEDIESLITQPLEKELSAISDLANITSTSREGLSSITLEFSTGVDVDTAVQEVREKVDKATLPQDAIDPIVSEINFSEFPIMLVNLNGDVDPLRLKEVGEKLEEDIEKIPGVLGVDLSGGLERVIEVEVDPARLSFYDLALTDVTGALARENVNQPGGAMDVGAMSYLVRVDGEIEEAERLENLVVATRGTSLIYVKDVATVNDTFEEPVSGSRFEGRANVSLSVQKRAGENLLEISDGIKLLIADYEAEYGATGIAFEVTADTSKQVNAQVNDLENNLLTGLLLVFAVLVFFMGGVRNSLFVALAIPLSMLLSFSALSLMGVTLNMVVLFALVLALGMLVDNAIVIVENIYRHAEMGKPGMQASREAVAEVGWPVITSTLTTIAAFAPMMFWPGIMGEFMGYLPLTVIVVLLSSLFVALVINPVVTARFIKTKTVEGGAVEESAPDSVFYRAYRRVLEWSLGHRWTIVGISVGGLIGTFGLFGAYNAGVEFFPETTPERIYVDIEAADGTRLSETTAIAVELEEGVAKLENVETYVLNSGSGGSHKSRLNIDFPEGEDLVEDPYATIDRVRALASVVPGASFAVEKEGMGPSSGKPIQIRIVGKDYGELGEAARQVRYAIKETPGLTDLDDNFVTGRPELSIRVDRDATALVKANTQSIANTVRTAVNGTTATKLRDGADEIDVNVSVDFGATDSPEALLDLRVHTGGGLVPLGELVELTDTGGTGAINHVDLDRVVTIDANIGEGFQAGQVLAAVQKTIGGMELGEGVEVRYAGENQDQAEASAFLIKAMIIALFLITLVLVTQFNSVRKPLVIVASVVLSLAGVLWGLMLTGTPFGVIMVGIGIVSLAGIVVNNAIVLIDYTDQLRGQGKGRREAIVEAGLVRLRPVLLTAVTTVLGLVPMAIGVSIDFFNFDIIIGGSQVEMWAPMARTVVSGLIVATVLTTIVVPVFYSLSEDVAAWLSRVLRSDSSWMGDAKGKAALSALVAVAIGVGAMLLAPGAASAQTLDEARQAARANNHDARLSAVRIEQASVLQSQINTVWLPRVSVSATYQINDQEQTAQLGPGQEVVLTPRTAFSARGTVSQTLFDGAYFAGSRSADLNAELASMSDAQLLLELDYQVTRAYYQILTLTELVEISSASIEQRKIVLESARARLSAGTAVEYDVTRAETEILAARDELAESMLALERGRQMLATLLVTDASTISVSDPGLDPPLDPVERTLEAAYANRPDLEVARKSVELRDSELDEGYWRYAPKVSAKLNATSQETTAFNPDAFTWNVQVIASWDLYDGGQREINIDNKRLALETSQIELDQAVVKVENDVRLAHADARTQQVRLNTAETRVALAQKGLEQAQRGYAAGAGAQVDVLDAEVNLKQARTQRATTSLNYTLARLELQRLSGAEIGE